jgi:hypothetical protein
MWRTRTPPARLEEAPRERDEAAVPEPAARLAGERFGGDGVSRQIGQFWMNRLWRQKVGTRR